MENMTANSRQIIANARQELIVLSKPVVKLVVMSLRRL